MAPKVFEAAKKALLSPRSDTDLPQNSFHTLRSGYNLIVYVCKELLGLDPVIVVNLSILFAAASTFGRYISSYFTIYLRSLLVSSAVIHEDDNLYAYLMKWMTDHQLKSTRFRSAKAKMVQKTSIEDEEEAFKLLGSQEATATQSRDQQLISYRTLMGRNPVQFQPYETSHCFYHKRNIYIFKHKLRQTPMASRAMPMRTTGELSIECVGRSLDPVKALLEEAQTYYLEKTMSSTTIFRGQGQHWGRISSRPSRDINTVILERTKKDMLLQDINEYLNPQTRRWYANHGIPYRRGYLFSGPPGTGKTSLTAALAGVFGLDIYLLSLLDPFLNEDSLVRLFAALPSRCIVLLEDIDAAGLSRNEEKKRKRLSGDDEPDDPSKPPRVSGHVTAISLSGLLNAIDGVSSSEGRILVMTTNKPTELDSALIRPGRVDVHIHFTMPERLEMMEMFLSMYRGLESMQDKPPPSTIFDSLKSGKEVREIGSATNDEGNAEAKEVDRETSAKPTDTPLTENELEKLAERFADDLPAGKFSLAAVQGYLMRLKHDPRGAVKNVKAWAEESSKET